LRYPSKETADETEKEWICEETANNSNQCKQFMFGLILWNFHQFLFSNISEEIGCRIGSIGFRNFDMITPKYVWKK